MWKKIIHIIYIISMKKEYQSHIYNSRYEIINDFQKETSKKERIYMAEMIKPAIAILDNSGITKYQNFYMFFKKVGLKSKDIINIINEFKNYINLIKNNQKIDWIKQRELNKTNRSEKNIIFNRLALEYPNELINFIYTYFCKINQANGIIIGQFKMLINEIEKQRHLNCFLKKFV